MIRVMLPDDQWEVLRLLLLEAGVYDIEDLRLRFEGVIYRARVGSPWRDLPAFFGPWKTVYNWYNRNSKNEKLHQLFYLAQNEPDNDWNSMDGSYVPVQQSGTGARGKSPEKQAIGKSRAGNTTKVHALVDAQGLPLHLVITPGNVSDFKVGPELIDFCSADAIVADKGYDSQAMRKRACDQGIRAVIPLRKGSKKKNPSFDGCLYYHRHKVENFFGRIKSFRAVSTRYDKLKRNFFSCLSIVCALMWVKFG